MDSFFNLSFSLTLSQFLPNMASAMLSRLSLSLSLLVSSSSLAFSLSVGLAEPLSFLSQSVLSGEGFGFGFSLWIVSAIGGRMGMGFGQ
jgi:hypothetical protein